MAKHNILVTGASRGLGKAIAENLAKQGHKVVGTATSAEGAAKISENISGAMGMVLQQDKPESVAELFAALAEQDATPEILIANAGITQDNLMLRMKDEEWQKTLDVNLSGNFHLCKRAIKPMVKARWGRILLVGSVVGSTGNLGQANYAAAKAGLIGLGRSLAREFASRNISVNILAPGFIETDMTGELDEKIREELLKNIPMHRYGTPEEVAALVSFLVSEEAGYITGQVLHINGGMFMGG